MKPSKEDMLACIRLLKKWGFDDTRIASILGAATTAEIRYLLSRPVSRL